jgi:5-methylcytosine-specific restriction endonuclease McrA
MSHTLILNSDWSPLSIVPLSSIPWRDAVRCYFDNKIRILHEYEDWVVRSPSTSMNVPSVAIVHTYVKMHRRVSYGRKRLWVRDNYTCQYCGNAFPASDLTEDHVVPQSHGGESNTYTNLVAACGPCNWKRGNNVRIQPKRAPHIPTASELAAKRRLYPVTVPHASWIDYIGWPEHLVEVVPPSTEPGFQTTAISRKVMKKIFA